MKKKIYKNNVDCIIFMILVYSEIMMESCLSYEKIVNECQKIYEAGLFGILKNYKS